MGWTHYWERGPDLPKQQFALAAADCRKVMEATGIALGNEHGVDAPVFSNEVIVFNGTGGAASRL